MRAWSGWPVTLRLPAAGALFSAVAVPRVTPGFSVVPEPVVPAGFGAAVPVTGAVPDDVPPPDGPTLGSGFWDGGNGDGGDAAGPAPAAPAPGFAPDVEPAVATGPTTTPLRTRMLARSTAFGASTCPPRNTLSARVRAKVRDCANISRAFVYSFIVWPCITITTCVTLLGSVPAKLGGTTASYGGPPPTVRRLSRCHSTLAELIPWLIVGVPSTARSSGLPPIFGTISNSRVKSCGNTCGNWTRNAERDEARSMFCPFRFTTSMMPSSIWTVAGKSPTAVLLKSRRKSSCPPTVKRCGGAV